jgi:hypothetical protein
MNIWTIGLKIIPFIRKSSDILISFRQFLSSIEGFPAVG